MSDTKIASLKMASFWSVWSALCAECARPGAGARGPDPLPGHAACILLCGQQRGARDRAKLPSPAGRTHTQNRKDPVRVSPSVCPPGLSLLLLPRALTCSSHRAKVLPGSPWRGGGDEEPVPRASPHGRELECDISFPVAPQHVETHGGLDESPS